MRLATLIRLLVDTPCKDRLAEDTLLLDIWYLTASIKKQTGLFHASTNREKKKREKNIVHGISINLLFREVK